MKQSYTIKTVETDDFSMDYMTFGSGEKTFVLLPGISLKSVLLSAPSIAAAYSCVLPDYTFYLFERKQEISEGYTVSDMADDTAKAMRKLGIRSCHLVGVSQGGMIAEWLTIRNPDLVEKLVLVSTLARGNAVSDETFDEWSALTEAGDPVPMNRSFFSRIYTENYLRTYEKAFSLLEKQGTSEEIHRLNILVRACYHFDVSDRLPEIRCPVFVIGSAHDRVLSGEASVLIAERIGCGYYLYENYGHALYDEAPDFMARVLAFLKA